MTQHTPWGWADSVQSVADGVEYVTTSSHGGLKIDQEVWSQLPQSVQRSFIQEGWAEEDCEAVIIMSLLDINSETAPNFVRMDRERVRAAARRSADRYYNAVTPDLAAL